MKISERLLLIGSTSAIADAVARRAAARGAALFLVARNADALAAQAADLRVRGASDVATFVLDVDDLARHATLIATAFDAGFPVTAALVAHGVLPDQARCETDVAEMLRGFDTNARSTLALLTLLANRFERQASGTIGVITSPAADRGRQSNYVYGAGKAAVAVFTQGLRHRFAATPVRVVTFSPGFVDTPMTAAFPKGPLWASADRVARDIDAGLQHGFGTIYTPWIWRWIMTLIRAVPERLFVRTRL